MLSRPRDRLAGRVGASLALALAAALALPGCRRRAGNEVVIGVLAARSGSRAVWGEDLYRGIELAVEQANARGGLLGRRVRLAVEDDASRDDLAAAAVGRLCERDGAVVVLGEVSTVSAERAAAAAARRSVPFVATGNTLRDVSRTGEFAFRTALTDAEQAAALARFARQTLQKRRAAIVYRRSSLLHLAIADAFAHAFRASGGDVVVRDSFTDEDTEMVRMAASVRAANADVLFVPALAADAARVAVAARHGRVAAQILGNDGWNGPDLRRFASEAVVGALITDAFAPTASRPEVEHFVETFRERYHAAPGTFAALGYDATRWVLAVAARGGQGAETRSLRDALAGSQLVDAVAGPFAVDARRGLTRTANILRVEHEGFTLAATAAP